MRGQNTLQIEDSCDAVLSSLDKFLSTDANLGANPSLRDLVVMDPKIVQAAKQAASLERTLQQVRRW